MSKGCWKFDEEDKGGSYKSESYLPQAVYIDLDEEDTEEDKLCKEYSSWDQTPDILLEEIFSYLSIRERYYASLVCRAWYRAFKLQNVWSTFTLEDTTLTRGKFNYYSGWQYVLDHIRTSTCLNKVGRNFRTLVFEPMLNFYNLYEFMNMISWYAERQGSDNTSVAGVGTYIRRLKFTFPCNMANRDDPDRIRVFGTGGKLLEALKRLMRNLQNLKCLELIDLMLESNEALHLMDDICMNCTQTLSKLILINTTRYYCPLLHVGVFVNLNVLVISPQNLHEDVIELIGYTKLRHLHILQNRYSPKDTTIRLPKRSSWIKMKANNPYLKVHFEIESYKATDILLPINLGRNPIDLLEHSVIPCHSIVLDNPNTQVSEIICIFISESKTSKRLHPTNVPQVSPSMVFHGTFFESTIRVYAFKGMIRDKISTATILEIVSTAKCLRCLYVRRNVVLKRFDRAWSETLDRSSEYYRWIKVNSRSYENTEREVSRILGYRWHMLSEKEFKAQILTLHI
ncbi:Uncharacterized protein DBV15_02874 [Temnothorax longispinosus]|uniref:F-box domain-containing protein n=1 Tax=Temnothorax longispinosus TaxID=300112 RepID=A0A4S2JLI9_9HYME|nr:Uncharacterized protein DBV15_02874 [Temnothorax longispinosus]